MGTALGGSMQGEGLPPRWSKKYRVGGAGIGNRLESQWVAVTAAVGEVDWGRGWEKEEVQSLSWRYRSKDQKLRYLVGPGQSPAERSKHIQGVGLKRLVYITHVRQHALSWL